MQLTHEKRGNYLLIKAAGRLDATWADFFTDTLLNHVRNGCHEMIIDAAGMDYISSAGIRSLLRVYKEINTVKGHLTIYRAVEFVKGILTTSGFDFLLADSLPDDLPHTASKDLNDNLEHYDISQGASLDLHIHDGWLPWQKVVSEAVKNFTFSDDVFALGIGSTAENPAVAESQFGEFLAVSGNVVFQTPLEESRPDYLIAEKDYVPAMKGIQAILLKGGMSRLLRFAPTNRESFFPVSSLLQMILEKGGVDTAGFVIVGEIEGLVGASLIRSPGLLERDEEFSFPEVKDWLSFSGERVFAHQQALIAGIVKKGGEAKLIPPLPSEPDLAAHIHAAIFPYQPLQNGRIDLKTTVHKFFSGPPPIAVMHLIDDNRPVVGLGQSALIRGAVWYAPVRIKEVLS